MAIRIDVIKIEMSAWGRRISMIFLIHFFFNLMG